MRHIIVAALLLLPIAAPAMADDPKPGGEKAADNPDRVICKRFLETGSLVRGYRTCKTKAEWQRERDNLRQESSAPGGCGASGQTGRC